MPTRQVKKLSKIWSRKLWQQYGRVGDLQQASDKAEANQTSDKALPALKGNLRVSVAEALSRDR